MQKKGLGGVEWDDGRGKSKVKRASESIFNLQEEGTAMLIGESFLIRTTMVRERKREKKEN